MCNYSYIHIHINGQPPQDLQYLSCFHGIYIYGQNIYCTSAVIFLRRFTIFRLMSEFVSYLEHQYVQLPARLHGDNPADTTSYHGFDFHSHIQHQVLSKLLSIHLNPPPTKKHIPYDLCMVYLPSSFS